MGQTLKVPLGALKVVQPAEVAVTIRSSPSGMTPEELAAIETKYRSEEKPLMVSLDQLQTTPPPQAPNESMLARATGAGPMIGGAVGGMVGGPAGAGLGAAAGTGLEQTVRHVGEIPGALVDVAQNLVRHPRETIQGAAEGMAEGGQTALLAGGVGAGLEAAGQAAMNTIGKVATGVYRGYLKPSLAGASRGKAQQIVKTAMDEALPIAQVGKDRADLIIKELKAEVDGILQSRQHISKTLFGDIDLHEIADRVRQFARTKYYKAGRPVEDFEAAMKVADNIDAHPSLNLPPGQAPGPLPVDLATANEAKRTLQQSAGDKAFGLERGAAAEAEKRGAHLTRKAIEHRAPVGPLNARESKLIDVAKALQGAIEREANQSKLHGVKTIGSVVLGEEAYRHGADPASSIALALGTRYLLSPGVASRAAILASRLAKVPGVYPTMAARVAIAVASESQQGAEGE